MSNFHYNTELFANKKLWETYDISGEIKNKINIVHSYIPEDVRSILDVGCGNGEITNKFDPKYHVVGVDNSEEALSYVKKDKILCSSEKMDKIEDNSFDMVFSSELIEHLPQDILLKTINEFKRICNNYILISVPNKEDLKYSLIKCPKCGSIFHAYGHLHSFDIQQLTNLLGDEFKLIKYTTLGKKVKTYNKTLLDIRHNLGKVFFSHTEFTVCPACNNRKFPEHKGNLVSKVSNGLNLILPSKKKKYWLMALFGRKELS